MPSFNESIQEFKKLKNESLKTKIEYIFTYYWIPLLIFTILMIVLISQILHFTSKKETVLSGHCINAYYTDSQQYMTGFSEYCGIQTDSQQVSVTTTSLSTDDAYADYVSNQLITAKIASKSLDFLTGDSQTLLQYAYQETFYDLNTILSAEQIQKLSDYFLYMDYTLVQQTETSSDMITQFPDPKSPDQMKMPIAFAIEISDGSAFDQIYYPHTNDLCGIGIIVNSPNLQNTICFIEYLCEIE